MYSVDTEVQPHPQEQQACVCTHQSHWASSNLIRTDRKPLHLFGVNLWHWVHVSQITYNRGCNWVSTYLIFCQSNLNLNDCTVTHTCYYRKHGSLRADLKQSRGRGLLTLEEKIPVTAGVAFIPASGYCSNKQKGLRTDRRRLPVETKWKDE